MALLVKTLQALRLQKKNIYAGDYDVIAVTETWLNASISDSEILNQNYQIYRRDGCEKTGGGVLLIIRSNIISSKRQDLETNMEMICVDLSMIHTSKLLLSIVYRPPNSESGFIDQFSMFLENSAHIQKSNQLILGDFNYLNIEGHMYYGFSQVIL